MLQSKTRKQQALQIASATEKEWCRALEPGEVYIPPVQGIVFVGKGPFPEDHYNPERYLQDAVGNFRTALGKKSGAKKKILELMVSLEKEIAGEDHELYRIEYPQAQEIIIDLKEGTYRGTWRKNMFYAREILRSPTFSRPGINIGKIPSLPGSNWRLGNLGKRLSQGSFGSNTAGAGAPWFRK